MKTYRLLLTLGLLCLLGAALSACQDAGAPGNAPTATPAAPAGFAAADFPTVVVPTPSADTGILTGRVVSAGGSGPLTGYTVYLGTIVPVTPGPDYTITIAVAGSPKGIIDSEGRFVISDVAAGDYPVVVWSMGGSTVVPDASGEKEMTVTIVAGEITDLGEVVVNLP